MGYFSKSKKNAPTLAAPVRKPAKPGLIDKLQMQGHQNGFLKHATRDERGMPTASCIYWNTNPPTKCSELQENSVFDLDGNDVEMYDKRDAARGVQRPTYVFNTPYGAKGGPDAVRAVGVGPDYGFLQTWLGQCSKDHKSCQTHESPEKLKCIELIDVRNRCLIRYKPGLQYVALSYVWGGAPAPRRISGRPSALPTDISKTILHAMEVADKIGVPFLWADAVCINQESKEEKDQQLPLMDYIYEHAFATIIALGDHASDGLPGVEGGPQRYSQLVAEFGPVKLISRCPTLFSQVTNSVWSTRGWTYQEVLFSRRCIYFSPHQVYFHCNSMFCTEDSPATTAIPSLVDSKVPLKPLGARSADVAYIRRNTLKAETNSSQAGGSLEPFTTYFTQYNSRNVSYDEDAIKAFGALLSYLQRNCFPRGFAQGIPKDMFKDALLWTAHGNICKREKGGFPSWSWAAWKSNGGMNYKALWHSGRKSIYPPLSVSLGKEQLYISPVKEPRSTGPGLELQGLWDAYRARDLRPFMVKTDPSRPNALYIDGPIATLPVKYDFTTQAIGFEAPTDALEFTVALGPPAPNRAKARHDFLIMDTKYLDPMSPRPYVEFTLLMLHWESKSVATRAGVLVVGIESGLDAFWKYMGIRRGEIWLI